MKCCYVVSLLALGVISHSVSAQSITGRAVAADDRQPIGQAFIVLLDENGQVRGGALSDSTGRWLIRAPAAGRYRLRLERIGFDNAESTWLMLRDSMQRYDFEVAARPFMLDAVRAESDGRGCARRDAEAVYRLWEEIQKALRLTRWTETNNALTFTTLTYSRETDARLKNVLRESRNLRTGRAAAPFGTRSPAQLITNGFSTDAGDELILHGIDARVLLAPEFVEHHCFRIQPAAQSDLIGLGFEPMQRRQNTQVRGVLWVDRSTAELRYLSYQYVQLPAALRPYDASAEVHFRKLQTGQWVIDRWWIRSPRLELRQSNAALRNQRAIELAGYHEDGGVLMVARAGAQSQFQLVGGGAIEGRVLGRSPGGGNAVAFLSGTPHTAMADETGRYHIVGVPPGTYALTVRDSLLDQLRLPSPVDSVTIAAGETVTRDVNWPAQADLLNAACPGETPEAGENNTGLLYGEVLHPLTATPVRNARIEVVWKRVNSVTSMAQRGRVGFSGADGRYYVCWIPLHTELSVTVTARDLPERTLRVNPATPIHRVDVR